MDNLIRLSILVTVPLLNLLGQGPFQFREAYLLENRIQVTRSGEEYDPAHSEVWQSSIGPSPARQFISDVNDLHVYSSSRWMGVLGDADKFRRMGGFEVAEKRYLLILEMLRKAQGEAASDVALMLDHLGEFYLEMRDFEKAYERLSQAAQVRRKTLAVGPFSNPSETPNSPDATAQGIYHLHLADLLTRLGQMDLAKEIGRAHV